MDLKSSWLINLRVPHLYGWWYIKKTWVKAVFSSNLVIKPFFKRRFPCTWRHSLLDTLERKGSRMIAFAFSLPNISFPVRCQTQVFLEEKIFWRLEKCTQGTGCVLGTLVCHLNIMRKNTFFRESQQNLGTAGTK